jgi:hypothetical protein
MVRARARRWLGPALFLMLAVIGVTTPLVTPQQVSTAENRVLAPAPRAPANWSDLRGFPRQIDRYLADHFTFRSRLLSLALGLNHKIGGAAGPKRAAAGQGGWYFLNDGLLRSAGVVADARETADFAQFVCQVSARLQRRGARVLLALAPSPGEIYPEYLPSWAGPAKRPTDYDRVLASVARCGVQTVDLRSPLLAAKGAGRLYRQTDSHWTTQGAIVGYNAVVRALGRPDWSARPDAMPWRRQVLLDGDLPRQAGLPPQPEDVKIYQPFEASAAPPRHAIPGVAYKERPPYRLVARGDGPSVVVIGDSFTETFFAPLMRDKAGSYVWLHQDECAFDWRAIEAAHPAYVIIAPAERNARCPRGRPLHMPPA